MKKLFILSMMFALTGCACFQGSDEPEETKVVYQTQPAPIVAPVPADCDYVEGSVCYRYVRRQNYAPAPVAEVRYRESSYREPGRRVYRRTTTTCTDCGVQTVSRGEEPCPSKIRTTREPVEVLYKKTTYKTVYEPKTFSNVSYEKEPYTGQVAVNNYRVQDNNEYVVINGNNDSVVTEEVQ